MAAPLLERWDTLEALLDAALDQPSDRRSSFLAQACAGEPWQSSDLERLLQDGERADDFLRNAAGDAGPLAASLAERHAPSAGHWLGSYLIERELGRGGMAIVYLAHDPRLQRRVALKVLRPELSGVLGPERFAREIAIAARLNHPAILPLYDSGALVTDDGVSLLFFSMPYITGGSLRERLRREPQLPEAEAVRIARQIGEALDYAHRQGVLHRDIKPENILLTESGPRVADFGIARTIDAAGSERLTQTGLGLGTPAYMSPEQASGEPRLDGRSDIYSLGCVLYEMLAGQPPFTGPTAQSVLARHAADSVPSLTTARPELRPATVTAVLRALRKVPADRYSTARAFAEALDESQAPGRLMSPPLAWRLPTVAAAGAALALAAGIVLTARTPLASPVRLDRARVAVAPFLVNEAHSSLGYLREGMVDLLAAQLGGTLALRPIDSRTLLSTWRRTGSGGLSRPEEIAVARRLGAGELIDGELASAGGRVKISAELLSVSDGRVRGRTTVEGSKDSVPAMVDRLAVRLLILAAGEPAERLASLESTPRPALRLYLDGQVIWRGAANPDLAQKKFEQALLADSTFALAALWTVRSVAEGGPIGAGEPHGRVAWRLRGRLPAADRAFLSLFLGESYPAWLSIRDQLEAAQEFTRREPHRADGWDFYGNMLASNGVLLGVAAARERAKFALARALTLDPETVGPSFGYILLAAELGDTAGLSSALARFLSVDPVSPLSLALQWRSAVARGDTTAARRAILSDSLISPHADASSYGAIWVLATTLVSQGVGLRDLDLLLQRSLVISPTGEQRARLRETQFYLDIMRGRTTGLAQPWNDGSWPKVERVIDALFADGDPAPAAQAAAALERELRRPAADQCCIPWFAAAEAALAAGRADPARRAIANLRSYRPEGPDSAAARRGALGYAAVITAQLAARDGSPRAAERLRALDSVLANPPGTWGFVMLYGNLIAARLHDARGESSAALQAIRRCDWTSFWPAMVTYHREEGRLAALAGDTAGAIRAYRRYLAIRADPDRRVYPQVQQVRLALARLERGRTGGGASPR